MMKVLIIGIFMIFAASCTPKSTDSTAPIIEKDELVRKNQYSEVKIKDAAFNKALREAIYFSSSLEREALKLILKNSSPQKPTLFSVLSYIVEINTGAKKTIPYGLDCGKFDVIRDQKTIKIYKSCVKPIVEIARVYVLEDESLYEVEFLIKEWANVVGLSVVLTGDNVRCQLKVKDRKLYRLKCDNWSYQTDADQISATVVKVKEFLFQRDAQKQFIIKGGFFKELVENKKIDVMVPIEGKIKIIEKEIQVIDEFVNNRNEESGKENEKKEELKKEISEKNIEEVGQEDNKEGPQEDNQESSQDVINESPEAGSEDGQRGRRGR